MDSGVQEATRRRRNRPVPNVEEGNHRLLLLVAKGPCRAFAIGIHSFSSVGAPRHRRCTRSVSPRLVGRPPSGRGCRTHANISRCGSRSAVMRVTWPHHCTARCATAVSIHESPSLARRSASRSLKLRECQRVVPFICRTLVLWKFRRAAHASPVSAHDSEP